MNINQTAKEIDREKSLKKKCRKIRQRMSGRAKNPALSLPETVDTPSSRQISKDLTQIQKQLKNQGTGPWSSQEANSLDKLLLSITRSIEKSSDLNVFLGAYLEFGCCTVTYASERF